MATMALNTRNFNGDISLKKFMEDHGNLTNITMSKETVTNTLGKTYTPRTLNFADGVQVKLSCDLCMQCDAGNNNLPGSRMFVYEEDDGGIRAYARPENGIVDTATTLMF